MVRAIFEGPADFLVHGNKTVSRGQEIEISQEELDRRVRWGGQIFRLDNETIVGGLQTPPSIPTPVPESGDVKPTDEVAKSGKK